MQLQVWQDVAEAITSMAVRGAPAIGIAAAWAVVLAAKVGDDLPSAIQELRASRPTAVNLGWALNRMQSAIASSGSVDVEALVPERSIEGLDLSPTRPSLISRV